MKKRIFSIMMDSGKKKTGIAIICAMSIITMGTGFAFAATNDAGEYISKNVVTSVDIAYDFLTDAYGKYSSYGVVVSEDSKKLLFDGQEVRLFVAEFSDDNTSPMFYLNEGGDVNISVIKDSSGEITGVERISEEQAQEFISASFEEDAAKNTKSAVESNTDAANKYTIYEPYGVMLSESEDVLFYNGQRVKLFVDKSLTSYNAYWEDKNGLVNLLVARNSSGEITGIESISEDKADELRSEMNEILQINDDYFMTEEFAEEIKENVDTEISQRASEIEDIRDKNGWND